MGCLPKYERILLKKIGFKNTYFQVLPGFPTLKETVAHIQPNGQFWTVFCQNGQNGNICQKSVWNIFSLLKALINCKVSEKSNERFSSNSVTYVRTDGRTYGRESLGLQRLRRETKNAPKIGVKWLFLAHFHILNNLFSVFLCNTLSYIRFQSKICQKVPSQYFSAILRSAILTNRKKH